ncbi:hypothetical protein ACFFX1_14135 [Dactylosporangium sucinum]|uniref:Uncharacterized protein n=1 Tax=Dactylosporangium sucinum TaxID=1424081 RepID=A0A917U7A4_9ACTN|nr:hypothetical protein [Dactylosporangium sucinum]GGM63465.1 hypothetical protein GCM10007977_076340 [Dactylosporangium sucinum]
MRFGQVGISLHQVLLRAAGWAPDEVVCSARDWLAQGRATEVAQAVVFVALAGRIPITPADLDVLQAVLQDDAANHDLLADLDVAASAAAPWWYTMSPAYPKRHAETPEDIPHSLDLTTDPTDIDHLGAIDAAAVTTVTGIEMDDLVDGLWRAWRFPAAPTPWPPPRRLYLVQATDPGSLPALTATMQRALTLAGETAPQVEAFTDADDLPPYQRTALAHSALLWTTRPTTSVRFAELFDPVDEVGGPGFAADRPTLDSRERREVLEYLEAASAVLTTTTLMDDVVNGRRRGAVPMNIRTDGAWVWTDAVTYYLRNYGLAPDPDLLQHIRTRRYDPPRVDAVAIHRALAALHAHTPGEDH